MTPEEARVTLKAITDDVKSKLDDFCKSIVNDREQLKNEYCDYLLSLSLCRQILDSFDMCE